jgi:hypothetical protein
MDQRPQPGQPRVLFQVETAQEHFEGDLGIHVTSDSRRNAVTPTNSNISD